MEGFGKSDVGSLGSDNTDLCRSALSGILHSVEWQLRTVVWRQPTGLIFKGQEVHENDLTLENAAGKLSRKIGTGFPIYAV